MTEKKMTEAEIMKALYSMYCATAYKDTITMDKETAIGIYDLINRKNADIESIRRKALLDASSKFAGHSDYHGDTILCTLICMGEGKAVENAKPLDISKIRAEAIKEFAERVKAKKFKEIRWNAREKAFWINANDIDQIAKEMGVEL